MQVAEIEQAGFRLRRSFRLEPNDCLPTTKDRLAPKQREPKRLEESEMNVANKVRKPLHTTDKLNVRSCVAN